MFTKKDESKRRFQLVSNEIEDQLDKLLVDRKLEIVKVLEGRVKFLKEEAEKKIEQTLERTNARRYGRIYAKMRR